MAIPRWTFLSYLLSLSLALLSTPAPIMGEGTHLNNSNSTSPATRKDKETVKSDDLQVRGVDRITWGRNRAGFGIGFDIGVSDDPHDYDGGGGDDGFGVGRGRGNGLGTGSGYGDGDGTGQGSGSGFVSGGPGTPWFGIPGFDIPYFGIPGFGIGGGSGGYGSGGGGGGGGGGYDLGGGGDNGGLVCRPNHCLNGGCGELALYFYYLDTQSAQNTAAGHNQDLAMPPSVH